jgi:hypothetical protein
MHLGASTESTALLFGKMAVLHSRARASVHWGLQITNVATRAVLSACCTSSTLQEGVAISFTVRLNSTETTPLCPTVARMRRHVDVADWKYVWNIRCSRYDVVFTRWDGKFRTVSLYRSPLFHKVSEALATCRETASVGRLSSKFLLTFPIRRASCSFVLSRWKPILLVTQQSVLVHFLENPS